jgi:cysteine synthase A
MEKGMRFDSIIDAIGRTPLVKLNHLTGKSDAAVYVKLESANPGSSIKDRIGAAMISAAEKAGKLKPGMTIVEPTSGNTGIALAMVAAAQGYRCVLVMPETMSLERRALLRQLGADIVLTPGSEGMKGAIKKASELAEQGEHFQPLQFSNPANPNIHRSTTAVEIIEDLAEIHLDAFVAGVGTGGTITGAGGALKEKYGCRVVAVEPDASPVLSGGKPAPHPIQGIGAGFVPDNYDPAIVDKIIRVIGPDAITTSRDLARREGILGGISTGANVWAALLTARDLGPGKTVVTIVCDTGERYISTSLFDQVDKRQ